jgi:hypothetical protein
MVSLQPRGSGTKMSLVGARPLPEAGRRDLALRPSRRTGLEPHDYLARVISPCAPPPAKVGRAAGLDERHQDRRFGEELVRAARERTLGMAYGLRVSRSALLARAAVTGRPRVIRVWSSPRLRALG